MNVATRLIAFAAVLGLAFGGAALAGAAIDPTSEEGELAGGHGGGDPEAGGGDAHGGGDPAAGGGDAHGGGQDDGEAAAGEGAHSGDASAAAASGLAVSEGGFALEIDRGFFTAGETAPLDFRITDERGRVVRDEYEPVHEKQLHLIVVRRDTAVFQHLHPRMGEDGTWSVDLNLPEPGVYRAYADFKIDGEQRTLATDLFVPGDFQPRRLPASDSVDRAVGDAGEGAGDLDVILDAPGVRAGRETPLAFSVTRDGQPFEALEPYLGAKGHLVALREGDLAYLHVHPTEGGETPENQIEFAATFPTAGRYRLFLQFKTGGDVRTVDYTLEVPR
ncbi:MAG: hypothetical protein ACR2LH_02910 [Thermoleophilaceae bacterium]